MSQRTYVRKTIQNVPILRMKIEIDQSICQYVSPDVSPRLRNCHLPVDYSKRRIWSAWRMIDGFPMQQRQRTNTRWMPAGKTTKTWWHVWIRRNPVRRLSFVTTNRQWTGHPNRISNHKNPPISSRFRKPVHMRISGQNHRPKGKTKVRDWISRICNAFSAIKWMIQTFSISSQHLIFGA